MILKKLGIKFQAILSSFVLALIGVYRLIGSPIFGGSCRFEPSCSSYAMKAFQEHNFLQAFRLSCVRIVKCRPGGGYGIDPVPCNKEK